MRTRFIFLSALLLPLAAIAAPVIIGDEAPAPTATTQTVAAVKAQPVPGAEFSNFPENAITRVGENTTGQHVDTPPTPPSPANPAAVAPASAPVTPANPASPGAPAAPVNKLWPRDTVKVFMPSCTGFRPQFVVPCTCTITKLMVEMPHDEFLAKSQDGTIEQDPRLNRIRSECATAPLKRE